jgi:hypothetical protein
MLKLWLEAASLAEESQQVIFLRVLKLMSGRSAAMNEMNKGTK